MKIEILLSFSKKSRYFQYLFICPCEGNLLQYDYRSQIHDFTGTFNKCTIILSVFFLSTSVFAKVFCSVTDIFR